MMIFCILLSQAKPLLRASFQTDSAEAVGVLTTPKIAFAIGRMAACQPVASGRFESCNTAVVKQSQHDSKAFDITYVRLKFHSPRPESFAIYKKSSTQSDWVPWQYYSATCRSTYGLADKAPILPSAETVAQCTSDYADISPLTGGNVAFSTLEGRPSAHRFESSYVLQEWVTASEIMVSLNRLNTFGDEVFRDDSVLRSYYYAIADFAVGGRCKCNGHAGSCVKTNNYGGERLYCQCEHNTQGEDCQECLPFYNDLPWKAATAEDGNECKPCNCSGLSNRCYFDEKLFAETGHGGHCADCVGNTRGVHCELCLENYWRPPGQAICSPCQCNEIGSASLQCTEDGQCVCKPGVGGRYCDQCLPGHYEFSPQGCRHCGCLEAGSLNNMPNCRPDTGDCACKKNVEGRRCDRCKPGFFNLNSANEFGCSPCFCYGHTSVCDVAPGFYVFNVSSDFTRGKDGWSARGYGGSHEELQYNVHDGNIMVREVDGPAYFVASDKFLGNQRSSYDQNLIFQLRVSEPNGRASIRDVVIEGGNGLLISLPIFAQNNPVPATYEQTYVYRLHEDPKFQWTPSLSTMDFLSLLSNVTAIKIRGTFASSDVGMLDSVILVSASRTDPSGAQSMLAKWIELCQCPDGFVGQYCESCAPGFRREPQYGGPFGRCLKCQCHNHATLCDAESGRCICEHNTAGNNCERCARGFYGNALSGSSEDCRPCPCPNNGPCILHTDGDVICIECPNGYAGRRCDVCADGYFGDPVSNLNCQLCECSGNIDQNSVGNCDRLTGECKKCIYNTYGFHCEKCLPGFYGDALLEPKGDCKPCRCYAPGTRKANGAGSSAGLSVSECEQSTGQCACLAHVVGLRCDQCELGYFNISSANGCQSCNCDPLGSLNTTCDLVTGQCLCKPGVVGLRCDQCAARHFGFSSKGCESCQCLPAGSTDLQCDVGSGQCYCHPNVEGRQCDRCRENMYNLQAGCLECPPCYKLIQKNVEEHRTELQKLRSLLQELIENPLVVNDTNFDMKLKALKESVDQLEAEVKAKLTDGPMLQQLQDLRTDIATANETLASVVQMLAASNKTLESSKQTMLNWENIKEMAYAKFGNVKNYLEKEVAQAWADAKEASEHFGRQSEELTKLAEQARNLAEKQKNESLLVEKNAMEALNISTTALNKSKEAIFGQQVTSSEIDRLEKSYINAEKMYNQTMQMAVEQLARSSDAYQKSAETLNKVDSLEMPSVDASNIKKKAELISEEAKAVKEAAQKLAIDNKPITNEISRVNEELEAELTRAEQQQQIADGLLAEIDGARAKARKAVQLADSTLKEANNTLHTLEEFDALIEASKQEAIIALKNSSQIENVIKEAESWSTDAEKLLGNASEDAKRASDIAKDASTEAEDAAKAAKQIRAEVNAAKESAQALRITAENVKTNGEKAADVISNYKTLSAEDRQKAQDALERASQGELAANRNNETIMAAMETLRKIAAELASLEEVQEADLDSLEARLRDASKTLEAANLPQEVSSLKAKQTEQRRKLDLYQEDISRLEQEVTNIEQIRDSLPHECYNVVDIEGTRRR